MKFVTYNIQYGLGRDGRYDLDRTARVVEGADVIALQEVERFWKRSGNVDEVAGLAERLPDFHWVYAPGMDVNASYRDEDGRLINRRRQFGIMLMSRSPIISSRGFPLPKYGTLKQHSIQQALLEGVIYTPAGPIRVYSAHLSHLSAETRVPQIEALLDIIDRAPAEGGAWCGGHPNPDAGWTEGEEPPMPRHAMIMGDLNFVPRSNQYDMIAGPLSPDHGRLVRRDGLLDAWVVAGHEENDRVTSPAVAPPPKRAGKPPNAWITASLPSTWRVGYAASTLTARPTLRTTSRCGSMWISMNRRRRCPAKAFAGIVGQM